MVLMEADDLIDACRRGERAALERLFETHAGALERLLRRLLGASPADVEDALQITFTEAIRSIAAFRGEAPIATWLCRIAVRVALTELQRPHRKRRVQVEDIEAGASNAPSPEARAVSKQTMDRVLAHLSALSPKNRVAFILFAVEGRSVEEVAALVGASVTATKSRIFLARRSLLERIDRDTRLREWMNERETRS